MLISFIRLLFAFNNLLPRKNYCESVKHIKVIHIKARFIMIFLLKAMNCISMAYLMLVKMNHNIYYRTSRECENLCGLRGVTMMKKEGICRNESKLNCKTLSG